MSDPTALATRTALPDALRVLVEAYPRPIWEAHGNFDGLVRFWLDRHLMFRRMMEMMQTDARAAIDGGLDPQAHAARLSRLGGMFINELHGHHGIEDQHYFPVLTRVAPEVARGFEILDRDHHEIDAQLDLFAKGANAILVKVAEPGVMRDRTGRFEADLQRVARFLDRHLLDEEDLVVPVILKHGSGALGH